MDVSEGGLLGRRVRFRQPVQGFRSGIEPILLAAAVHPRRGERVLEAGTGAGAALLSLAWRHDTLAATGIEIDPALAALAAENAALNRFDGLQIRCGAVEQVMLDGVYDHAMANPPYHDAAGTPSPDLAKVRAKQESAGLLEGWIARMAGALRHRGTLTLILPTRLLPPALDAMRRTQCPCTSLYPLWPRQDEAAKLILLQGIRDARMPMRLLPGLVLHEHDGTFTAAARAILEGRQVIRMAELSSPT